MHLLSEFLLLTMHAEHSQDPVGGANFAEREEAGVDLALGVEQATQDSAAALLPTMHTSHSQDPAAGANFAEIASEGAELLLAFGFGVEQATQALAVSLLETMHDSHSHAPVGGASCILREAVTLED